MITQQYCNRNSNSLIFFSFERLQLLKALKARKRSWHQFCFIMLVEKYGLAIQKNLLA